MWPEATVKTWIVSRSPSAPPPSPPRRAAGAPLAPPPVQEETLSHSEPWLPSSAGGGGRCEAHLQAGKSDAIPRQVPRHAWRRPGAAPQRRTGGSCALQPPPPQAASAAGARTRGVAGQHVLHQPRRVLAQEQVHVLAAKRAERHGHLRRGGAGATGRLGAAAQARSRAQAAGQVPRGKHATRDACNPAQAPGRTHLVCVSARHRRLRLLAAAGGAGGGRHGVQLLGAACGAGGRQGGAQGERGAGCCDGRRAAPARAVRRAGEAVAASAQRHPAHRGPGAASTGRAAT